ncbi:MAG: uroporphyrinogen decarboxylase [Treponema sp.]|jgi:uroporphyrinogen decarboxylase|nr:uroporphyrinogen decarboxylase [Treponema sp.]
MAADKREWVSRAFHNEKVEKVPAGFWFHFTPDEVLDGFQHPEMFEQNMGGHLKYYREFQPDFVKIMSDGFFIYPNREFQEAETAADLRKVSSIGPNHPWIEKQVEFVKKLTAVFGKEVLSFYNIFSPATCFKFSRRSSTKAPEVLLGEFIREDREALIHALNIAAEDLAVLARRVITEGGADGIYFSAQDPNQDGSNIDAETHRRVFAPADALVLEAANAAAGRGPGKGGALNILHVCGYAGRRNDLGRFTGYPAQIINWAVTIEGVPLGEGKKLFGGRPVIGGFGNTTEGILYRGTEAEIKAETRRILDEAGRTGVVLGADCTVPRDIDLRHLQWVREAV